MCPTAKAAKAKKKQMVTKPKGGEYFESMAREICGAEPLLFPGTNIDIRHKNRIIKEARKERQLQRAISKKQEARRNKQEVSSKKQETKKQEAKLMFD